MTKEDFLIVSDLLTGYDFDELDKVEFFMGYERKSNTKIPDEWFAEAQLQKPEKTTDWESFRREAAKDLLAGLAASGLGVNLDLDPAFAVKLADELIKQLRENEK